MQYLLIYSCVRVVDISCLYPAICMIALHLILVVIRTGMI